MKSSKPWFIMFSLLYALFFAGSATAETTQTHACFNASNRDQMVTPDVSCTTISKVQPEKKLSPEKVYVINPYTGADQYINPDYSHEIEYSLKHADSPGLAAKMRSIQSAPTAIWLDRIDAIAGGKKNNHRLSLEDHFIRALAQQREAVPMVVTLVLYNLPNRDCSALSSNGTLDFRTGGLNTYKANYINSIAALIEDPRFASLRIVSILEPDSLPNMITNLWNKKCKMVYENHVYEQGIVYAIEQLGNLRNSYIYMDIGHSGWRGWDENIRATVSYFTRVITSAKIEAGLAAVNGFVTNISGSTPTEETLLTDPDHTVDGLPVKSAEFYSWNSMFDEKNYIEELYDAFTTAGFSKNIRFLIDTSRNGWGGKSRPQTTSTAATVNDYVEQSRLDRRFHRGNWCNPRGAGLGERPTAEPYGSDHPIAAFIWVKPPGESDGTSDPRQTEADAEGKRYDKMCDPDYVVDYGPSPSHKPTGALANAPPSGHWFHAQFSMLVNNAYPPIKGTD
ncbi:MAG: glycoside hydrolase family 6 protein [Mariprofundus sp.]